MIEVKNLTKRYGDFTAVDNISFTIDEGHVYGFLGPNGAGKSTTMNIMTGCLAATGGDVLIDGHDIFEEPQEAKKLVGYLPEIPPLYVDQTPREYLEFVAEAKGIRTRQERVNAIEEVIAETHIEAVADKLIKKLSKGYRQRVGIAQALLGSPRVIILDEPTVGLDPMQIIEIRDLIKELGTKHTVILSSHILSEVQAICDMVIIIRSGRIVAFDKTEELGSSADKSVRVELSAECDEEKLREILAGLAVVTGIQISGTDGTSTSAVISTSSEDTKAVTKEMFAAFVEKDVAIIKLNPVKASLEDIFIELTAQDSAAAVTETADEDSADDEQEFTDEELAELAEAAAENKDGEAQS